MHKINSTLRPSLQISHFEDHPESIRGCQSQSANICLCAYEAVVPQSLACLDNTWDAVKTHILLLYYSQYWIRKMVGP